MCVYIYIQRWRCTQMHTTSASAASTRRAPPAVDGSSPGAALVPRPAMDPSGVGAAAPPLPAAAPRQQPQASPLDTGPPQDAAKPRDASGPPQEKSSGPPRDVSSGPSGEARESESSAARGPHVTRRRSGGALIPKVTSYYRGTSLIRNSSPP